MSHRDARAVTWGVIAASITVAVTALAAGPKVRVPLACTRGPKGQHFDAAVAVPSSAPEGSTYTIRIDGIDSGEISHTGLNYIHDMTTDFGVPKGTRYVDGSARIVPDTGTANVAAGARVSHEHGVIRQVLPGHVESGSRYTPPSIEFQVRVDEPAGSSLALTLLQFRVTANAFLVGDLDTTCDPTPKPFTLGATTVSAAPAPLAARWPTCRSKPDHTVHTTRSSAPALRSTGGSSGRPTTSVRRTRSTSHRR